MMPVDLFALVNSFVTFAAKYFLLTNTWYAAVHLQLSRTLVADKLRSQMARCDIMFWMGSFQGNYVLERDEQLSYVKEEYDTILALSITKWIHLNWGDDGLKRVFARMYQQLRPGGQLILEPQAWASYRRRKKLTVRCLCDYLFNSFFAGNHSGCLSW